MEGKMVHFVGAGPGAPDLITVRGARLIGEADVIIYAGSLVNPALLEMKKESCRICDSAKMTLEEVIETIKDAEKEGLTTVRLHTGDPCVYGAVREQMDLLAAPQPLWIWSIPCPGSHRVWSSPGWRAGLRSRTENLLKPSRRTARRWSFF